jgi:hypothetical protein
MPHPTPPLIPFDRLRISDGLLINAERWQLAHSYHRQRQNLYFQSLNQPGIVDGLEVCVIPAPSTVPSQYRDQRWVQIQPGLAIDVNGNPIVVPDPVDFHISSMPDGRGDRPSNTVYLVLRYVDPDTLATETLDQRATHDVMRETYRIDEISCPPQDTDIELCRIQIQPDFIALSYSQDVLYPKPNTLDLRHRPQVCPRSTASIRVAVRDESPLVDGICSLVRSLPGLYPHLQPLPPLIFTELTPNIEAQLWECSVLFLSNTSFTTLSDRPDDVLQRYIQAGGSVIVEHSVREDSLNHLLTMHQRLNAALMQISSMQDMVDSLTGRSSSTPSEDSDLDRIHSELAQEMDNIAVLIDEKLSTISDDYDSFIRPLDITLTPWENLPPDHPLRCQPFHFSRLPTVAQQLQKILVGRGFSIILGNVTSALQGYVGDPLSRSDLRAIEELGINALHTTWQRHRLIQLQRGRREEGSKKREKA